MGALDRAARGVTDINQRVAPLIDRNPLASTLRDKVIPHREDVEVPSAEVLRRPFETPSDEAERAPLGDAQHAAQVYGRDGEPWTQRARQLLEQRQLRYAFVDLAGEGGLAIETRLMRETEQHGGLYVFLRGKYVGGFHALNEIARLGQLEEMTKSPDERRAHGRVRVVIPARGGDDTPMGELGG